MSKEKLFDCVKFKDELQKNMLKNSGASNLQEYVSYANNLAQKSSLHKTELLENWNMVKDSGKYYKIEPLT